MTTRQQKRAPEKSSSTRFSDVTRDYRIKFAADGDLMGPTYRIAIKIALPTVDLYMGLFRVTPLSAFGESVFRRALSRHDVVQLYVGGCYVSARVATKGNNTGTIWIYADEVLRGLARLALVCADGSNSDTQNAKREKAGRNG
jgi:hypothetical protein